MDGLEISIDVKRLSTPKILEKIIWTLHYDGIQEGSFKDIKSIKNVEKMIEDPILGIYTTLYNTLKLYSQTYYTSTTNKFTVNFYSPYLGGMSLNTRLYLQHTGELSKNSIENIYFGNEDVFRKKIASVVLYMVKYAATINIKEGGSQPGKTNVLQANLLRILDPHYMLQNFNPKAKYIGGNLRNSWFTSTAYQDLKTDYEKEAFTLSNLFPIWEFSDADNFNVWLGELFNRKNKEYGASSIFPDISDPRDLLEMDF